MKKLFIYFAFAVFCSFSLFAQTSPYGKVLWLDSNGTQRWDFLPPEAIQNAGWTLTGNAITGSHFLGTTNAFDLIFRTNNIERMRLWATGGLGLFNGTAYITFAVPASLTSNLTFYLPTSYGTSGQVLTTDGSGNLSWASLPETDPVWTAAEPNYANLGQNEVITGNWDNTANPWADNEVADNLTINGGTINNTPIGGTTPAAGTFTNLTANGNVTLGDATSDNVVFTARVGSNFIPNTNNTYDLGTNALQWKDIYYSGALTGGSATFSSLVVTGTSDLQGAISNTSSNNSGRVYVNDDFQVTGNALFDGDVTLGNANTDNVVFNAEVNSHIIPNINITYDLGSSTQRWRTVYANGIRSESDGYRLVYYPSTQKAFFDIVDPGTNQPLVTIGPATNSSTLENGGVAVKDRTNGNLRAGLGWDITTNSWSVGVGVPDNPSTPYGVRLLYNPSNN
ncbi:MAG: hypothetical protein WHV60_08965, partial [Bacteroidota bacterium]